MHNFKTKYIIYAEIAICLVVVITAIRLTRIIPSLEGVWFLTPAILFAGATLPTLLKKQKLAETILPLGQIKYSLTLIAKTSIVALPLMLIAIYLLKHFGVDLPMAPTPPEKKQIASWLIFQFLYIATFEEIFFRGYLQSNILKALNKPPPNKPATKSSALPTPKRLDRQQWTAISASATAFTLAHIIINADPIQILVLPPAIIFGFLFAKTKSLIAPILFHGLANTAYCILDIYY